jgi:Family of unknown function (DUF5678)
VEISAWPVILAKRNRKGMVQSLKKSGESMRANPLDIEEKTFRRKRGQLLDRYEGQFVALYGGRLVGHGADDEELAAKMFEKLGDAPFFIAKVEKEATVYELPSPELGE